jgi:two-component system chemotaxis response regulator CheB
MFDSVAKNVGSNAVGVLLTGMGKDGAEAMLRMRNKGGRTLAQNESSSVVFGMPKAAFECGGAERLVDIKDMASTIIEMLEAMK